MVSLKYLSATKVWKGSSFPSSRQRGHHYFFDGRWELTFFATPTCKPQYQLPFHVLGTWSTDPKPVLGSSKWTISPNMVWTIQVLPYLITEIKKEQSFSSHFNSDLCSFQMRKTRLTTRKSRKLCSWKSEPPRLTRCKGFFLPCKNGWTICYGYGTVPWVLGIWELLFPSRIPDPKVEKHLIPDPDPQHWFL